VLKLPEKLSDLFAFDPVTLVVFGREGKRREFKLDYFQKDIADYTKTLAAFANADGGCIIFGVRDRPREIVGVSSVIRPKSCWPAMCSTRLLTGERPSTPRAR
jgi:hypothetical protein